MKISSLPVRTSFVYGRSVYVVAGPATTGRIRAAMVGKLHLSGGMIPIPAEVKYPVRHNHAWLENFRKNPAGPVDGAGNVT